MLVAVAAASFQPKTVVTVDPKHRIVEGVASDGHTIWVSSILDRTILACRKSCRPLAVLPPGLHPFTIAWDSVRKRLWVAADCPPGVPGITACDRGALIGIDRSGREVTRIAPAVGIFHPGDVSATAGRVFLSDNRNGMVFALGSTGKTLMAVVYPGVGKSAQGTALDPSGTRLIVADYSKGIASVELAKWTRTLLPRQDGKPLRGIDGLVRCGNRYIGIYDGDTPGRLLVFTVGPQGIVMGDLIEGLTLPDPTQVAYDGKRLLIVADSGWATIDKPAFVRTQGAPIIAIPLSKDCKPIQG